MRTPEAGFAVKSQPFSTKCEYDLFVTGECHGWKEVKHHRFFNAGTTGIPTVQRK
jgi:hypothetical protein